MVFKRGYYVGEEDPYSARSLLQDKYNKQSRLKFVQIM